MKTAEELLKQKESYEEDYPTVSKEDTIDAMVEFAKLHVEAALKAAAENAKQNHLYFDKEDNYEEYMTNKGFLRKDGNGDSYGLDVLKINKDSILNSYPLKNIK